MSDFNRKDYPTELHGKIVKARIVHNCNCCGMKIEKGEHYDFSDGTSPTYTNYIGERVKGSYWTFRTHLYDCSTPEQCLLGNHEFKEIAPNFDDLIPGEYETRCINCGILDDEKTNL